MIKNQPTEEIIEDKKQPTEEKKKSKEKRGEKGFRSYFFRVFGKYDFRDKEQFIRFGKWLLFVLLIMLEFFMLLKHFDTHGLLDWKMLVAILVIEAVFTVSQALKLFVFKTNKMRLYAIDAVLSCSFMFLTEGVYPIAIFMIVLTEFYITAEKLKVSIVMICLGSFIYECGFILRRLLLLGEQFDVLPIFTQSFGSLLALLLHFLIVQIGLAFYSQFLKLNKTINELDKSKKELEKAYEVVAEVSALEERQRIAKDIHDTAGHSITTVIMQTEAAKRILEKNPEEAKSKIVAANLQAKHALEELRESVHLLSGMQNQETLRSALESIIHESMDGTNIKIRSQIEDVEVSPTKHRFLCNTLKEGISNGLRHGGATAFWFELKQQDGVIAFLLSDNGKGLNVNDFKLGFGLSAMRDRAKSLGGEVRFDGEIDEGFELHLFLPADNKEKGVDEYAKD